MRLHFISILCFALLPMTSHAQFGGPEQFPPFRDLCGLAGCGYGVDVNGYRSLAGPTAHSTPVAYTLGRDQFDIQFSKLSNTNMPKLRDTETNGNLIFTYGHTFGKFNIAITEMILSTDLDQSLNLQVQYIPSPLSRWAASIGCLELIGANKSMGVHDELSRSSRSPFAVVTYRVSGANHPIFLSAGIGARRYKLPFGSASWQFLKNWRLWVEHDGFGVNEGVLYSYPLNKKIELSGHIGFVQSRYCAIGVGMGF